MQFVAVEVGNRDLAFAGDHELVVPFAFPRPVTRVHCMLQGIFFRYPDDDEHLLLNGIEPRVEFDSLASPTSGQIRVDLHWRNDHTSLWDERLATFWARLLLVGE